MDQWETITLEAKVAFKKKCYLQAVTLNKQALSISKNNFDEDFEVDPEKAIAKITVSHYNLADSYTELHDLTEAYSHLENVLEMLKYLIHQTHFSSVQSDAIVKSVSVFYREWNGLLKRFTNDECANNTKHILINNDLEQLLNHSSYSH